jgi:chorismate dehydratase
LKFGSISYLNLLPFQIFFKKNISNCHIKKLVSFNKSYPSIINRKFLQKKIDAAFISSIKSKNQKCTNLGIISYKEVYSVFLIPNKDFINDLESDTSNMLAKILNLKGKIIIGDKALKLYLHNKNENLKDLSLEWYKKYKLPFVFARLCFNKKSKRIKKLVKKFSYTKTKIPQYYLKKEASKKGISEKDLLWYLDNIYYKIGWREEKALKLFLKKAKRFKK